MTKELQSMRIAEVSRKSMIDEEMERKKMMEETGVMTSGRGGNDGIVTKLYRLGFSFPYGFSSQQLLGTSFDAIMVELGQSSSLNK